MRRKQARAPRRRYFRRRAHCLEVAMTRHRIAMPYALTPKQLELLAKTSQEPLAASTLRSHSELRWLEQLRLVALDADGRFGTTADGLARLRGEDADSRIDS